MILADFSSCCCFEFWLPFPPAAAEASVMILAAFSSCCCYEFWLPFPPAAAEASAAAAGPRMGKHRNF